MTTPASGPRNPYRRSPIRLLFLCALAGATLTFVLPSNGASDRVLKNRETRQIRTLHRHVGTVRFFKNHRFLLHGRTRPIALHALKVAHVWIPIVRRELAETRSSLKPPWPAHHALWMCIHGHEAGDWGNQDTGRNGHYGGLQMHPGWGYGTSYHASDDSQFVQEWSAERGYRASGFSTRWLLGQWFHPDCVAYA